MSHRAPLATIFFLRRLVPGLVTDVCRLESTRAGCEARQSDVERPQHRSGGRIDPKKNWGSSPRRRLSTAGSSAESHESEAENTPSPLIDPLKPKLTGRRASKTLIPRARETDLRIADRSIDRAARQNSRHSGRRR